MEKKVAKAMKQMVVGKEPPSIRTKISRAPKEVAVKDIPTHRPAPMKKLETYKLLGGSSTPVGSPPPGFVFQNIPYFLVNHMNFLFIYRQKSCTDRSIVFT